MSNHLFFIDFFSYWIFTWFICFQLRITKYNPFCWLWIALIASIFAIFYMFYSQNDCLNITLFCLEVFVIKILLILLLWDSIIHWKDFLAGLLLLCIYLLFLAWNQKLFYPTNTYYQFFHLIYKNQPSTPFVRFMRFYM